MKILNFSLNAIALFGLFAGGLSSCVETLDLAAERKKQVQYQYQENFVERFGNACSDQDFNMAQQVTMTVSTDDYEDVTGTYIKVYTELPENSSACLLASYPMTGTSMQITFDSPKNLGSVFVTKVRANGFYATKVASIADRQGQVSFGTSGSSTRAVSGIDDYYWPTELEKGDSQFPESYPADDVCEITGHISLMKHEEGKAYYIKDGVTTEITNKNLYIHQATIDQINMQNGGLNYYFAGDVKVNYWIAEADGADPVNIYFLPNSTVDINRGTFDNKKQTLTICEGSNVTFTNCYQTQAHFYNRGTISFPANYLQIGDDAFVQNEGTVTAKNVCNLTKDRTIFINKNLFSAGYMEIAGSSAFYNLGEATISGELKVNSNTSTWYNRGSFTTKFMVINSASNHWINSCKLFVTSQLKIVLADGSDPVHMEGYIRTKDYYQNNARVEMAADAQIEVTGVAHFNWNLAPKGIFSLAPEGSQAVFKANKVVMESGSYPAVSYGGYLTVDCPDHFQYERSDGHHNYYVEGVDFGTGPTPVTIAKGGNSYTIPESECSEPYEPTPPDPLEDTPYTWTVACEDLGTSDDFDFNDVVLGVSHVAGQDFLYITPLAAGGTLASVIYYDQQCLGEIHLLLAGAPTCTASGNYEILNTYRDRSEKKATAVKVTDIPTDFSMVNNDKLFISVIPKGEKASDSDKLLNKSTKVSMPTRDVNSGNLTSTTPQMLVLPDGWIWPAERHQIDEAYPDFAEWVSLDLTDWISSAQDAHLYKSYGSVDASTGSSSSSSSGSSSDNTSTSDPDEGEQDTPVDLPTVNTGESITLYEGEFLLNFYPGFTNLKDFKWDNVSENSVLQVYFTYTNGSLGGTLQLTYQDQNGQYVHLYDVSSSDAYVEYTLTASVLESIRNSQGIVIFGGNNNATLTKVILKK